MQGLGELAQLLTPLAQLEPSADEPEPTWLLENGELPENMALTAANLNVSAATLLKQLTAVQDALVEARRDKTKTAGKSTNWAASWVLLPAPRRSGGGVGADAPPARRRAAHRQWITTRQPGSGRRDWQVCASPVSAAADLANNLWRLAAGAVADLGHAALAGLFDLLAQTGLKWLGDTECVALESPFDFQRQGELYVPAMRASPGCASAHR